MGFSEEGKWWWKWFYWMDVARMILLNLQMVLLHVNAGPNSLEASVNNWKLCIFQVWCIVKFLCCGWSPSSGIRQTGFKSWLAPKKYLLYLPTKNSWAPSCCIGEVLPGVVAGFGGFLRQFGWGIFSVQSHWGSPFEFFLSIFVYEEIVDTVHSLIDFFAYIKLCQDL